MDVKYFWGRKLHHTNYRLYKKQFIPNDPHIWWKAHYKNGSIDKWNSCFTIPTDIKEISNIEAFIELL